MKILHLLPYNHVSSHLCRTKLFSQKFSNLSINKSWTIHGPNPRNKSTVSLSLLGLFLLFHDGWTSNVTSPPSSFTCLFDIVYSFTLFMKPRFSSTLLSSLYRQLPTPVPPPIPPLKSIPLVSSGETVSLCFWYSTTPPLFHTIKQTIFSQTPSFPVRLYNLPGHPLISLTSPHSVPFSPSSTLSPSSPNSVLLRASYTISETKYTLLFSDSQNLSHQCTKSNVKISL